MNAQNDSHGAAFSASRPAAVASGSPVEADAEVVLAQLERIVQSPVFRNSKRYPRFLKFIVEQTLLGHADTLKERLLGIEVFDRPPDYDLATDSIVRVAAGEVRKRLAQYYIESGHENELRIQLQPGSYVPEFCSSREESHRGIVVDPVKSNTVSESKVDSVWPSFFRQKWLVAMVAAGFIIAVIFGLHMLTMPSPLQKFWQPFIESPEGTIICLSDTGKPDLPEATAMRTGVNSHDRLALGDVEALNRISSMLAQKRKATSVSNSLAITFADLSNHPAILIGGSRNQWTMHYMQLLRFQLVADYTSHLHGIVDRVDPHKLRWEVNFNVPYNTIPEEYAIVARFHNPATGQPTVIAAGVGANGEMAAADFLTTPAYFKQFAEGAPRDWEDRNMEIILETQMINGTNGPPKVVTTYFW